MLTCLSVSSCIFYRLDHHHHHAAVMIDKDTNCDCCLLRKNIATNYDLAADFQYCMKVDVYSGTETKFGFPFTLYASFSWVSLLFTQTHGWLLSSVRIYRNLFFWLPDGSLFSMFIMQISVYVIGQKVGHKSELRAKPWP